MFVNILDFDKDISGSWVVSAALLALTSTNMLLTHRAIANDGNKYKVSECVWGKEAKTSAMEQIVEEIVGQT